MSTFKKTLLHHLIFFDNLGFMFRPLPTKVLCAEIRPCNALICTFHSVSLKGVLLNLDFLFPLPRSNLTRPFSRQIHEHSDFNRKAKSLP